MQAKVDIGDSTVAQKRSYERFRITEAMIDGLITLEIAQFLNDLEQVHIPIDYDRIAGWDSAVKCLGAVVASGHSLN